MLGNSNTECKEKQLESYTKCIVERWILFSKIIATTVGPMMIQQLYMGSSRSVE